MSDLLALQHDIFGGINALLHVKEVESSNESHFTRNKADDPIRTWGTLWQLGLGIVEDSVLQSSLSSSIFAMMRDAITTVDCRTEPSLAYMGCSQQLPASSYR
jgi:hypothetical protein